MMVIGNVKDKWCFSTLSFMKSKFRNRWTIHLDLVVKMFVQDHYSMDSFPFEDAIIEDQQDIQWMLNILWSFNVVYLNFFQFFLAQVGACMQAIKQAMK